ncbi:hypothetical protein AA0242T_2300 [Acetobacter aceti NRIC 0242]|uniref:Uncharacterized protein n=2 Tax=Acetobacter aceti TaxID=435 RepID=A0AB33ILD0_ACEAC|nr:hypothetical protein [Acetobacter aceti]TCS33055.1 hypothetical protein EDC15_109127 [Acetobacter aceti NBRC 14818]BCK76489.1 hypothetical protein EMQ_2095 [Acetobacter aceti NBRC 14818]GBO81598.1 hypothetical protein AA0242T_2300 [Acetobacter aceti NRIC 0242]
MNPEKRERSNFAEILAEVPLLKAYHLRLERERNDPEPDAGAIEVLERAIADVTKFLQIGDPNDLSDDVWCAGQILAASDIPGGWQRWDENVQERVEREKAAKKAARAARRARA